MHILRLNGFLAATSVLLAGFPTAHAAGGISLLECIGRVCEIPVDGGGVGPLFLYIALLYPWLVGTCAGIAVLWGLFGGIMWISAGGDQNKAAEAKKKMTNAILGLLLIIFSALIMNILNPTFYK